VLCAYKSLNNERPTLILLWLYTKLARNLWEPYEYVMTRNNCHQASAAEYGNPRSRNTFARSIILNIHRKTGQLLFLDHVTFSCVLKQFSMEERWVVCRKSSRNMYDRTYSTEGAINHAQMVERSGNREKELTAALWKYCLLLDFN